MKIIEKEDEITLRAVPVVSWTLGAILLLFSILIVIPVIRHVIKYPNLTHDWWHLPALVISSIGLWLSYLKISRPMITTQIRPGAQTFDITSRKFIISKTKRIYFSQIKRVERLDQFIRWERKSDSYFFTHLFLDVLFYSLLVSLFPFVKRRSHDSHLFITVLTLLNDSHINLESTGSWINDTSGIPSKLNDLLPALKKHQSQPVKSKSGNSKSRKTKQKMKEKRK